MRKPKPTKFVQVRFKTVIPVTVTRVVNVPANTTTPQLAALCLKLYKELDNTVGWDKTKLTSEIVRIDAANAVPLAQRSSYGLTQYKRCKGKWRKGPTQH